MGLWVPSAYKDLGLADISAKAGITVTASATPHAVGAWASLLDPVSFDIHAITVALLGLHGAATNTSCLVNIAHGPTGGGSETTILPNLDASAALLPTTSGSTGKCWTFPVFIKNGLRISANAQAVIVSDTVLVRIYPHENPMLPGVGVGGKWFAYGQNTAASQGTSVTAAAGSFGTWTQIGASNVTAVFHTLWHCGFDFLTDTTATGGVNRVEIGYGPDNANVVRIGVFDWFTADSAENLVGPSPSIPAYCPVPAASTIWARIDGTTAEARGVIIYAA